MIKIILILSVFIGSCYCDLYYCNQNCFDSYSCPFYSPFAKCVSRKSSCSYTDDCSQESCYDSCKSSVNQDSCQQCFQDCTNSNWSCSTSTKVGIIVGVVLGVSFLVILIIGCYCYQKRKQQRQKIQTLALQQQQNLNLQQMEFNQNFQQLNNLNGLNQGYPVQDIFIPAPQYQAQYQNGQPMYQQPMYQQPMYQQPLMNGQGVVYNNNQQAKIPQINNIVL